MSVIITGIDMQQDCMKCPLDNWLICKVSGKLCKQGERPEHCTLKSVESLVEEIKAEYELAVKQLYWEKAAGLQKAIEIIEKNTEVGNGADR